MNTRIVAVTLACAALQACAAAGGPVLASAPATTPVLTAELRALAEDSPWWCFGWDEAHRTCESIARATWHDGRSGTAQIAFMLSAEPRVKVVASMPVRFGTDTICGHPAEMSVEVGVAPDAALPGDAAEQIEESMLGVSKKRRGSVMCVGAVREARLFRLTSHDDAGEMVEEDHTFRLFADPPALSMPDTRA